MQSINMNKNICVNNSFINDINIDNNYNKDKKIIHNINDNDTY